MKRKVVCIFSLILFFLIFCTLLTPSIQREMRTLIQVKGVHEALKMYNHPIPKIALSWPDGAKLYQVIEGKGWNTGLRIEEVPEMSYHMVVNENFITGEKTVWGAEIYPGKNFDIVLMASRQPAVGDAITEIKEFAEREDTYIICYPQGAEDLNAYPNSFTPIAQTEKVLLVKPTKAYTPYFEQQTLNSLTEMGAKELRAYSTADAKQFYEMMPLVALLAACLMLGVMLWGYSCVLVKRGDRPLLLWRNVALGAGLLCVVPIIANRIDLPASLLPRDSILNIGHYRTQFRQIFSALESVGSDLLLQERSQCLRSCGWILAASLLVMIVLVVLDRVCKRK